MHGPTTSTSLGSEPGQSLPVFYQLAYTPVMQRIAKRRNRRVLSGRVVEMICCTLPFCRPVVPLPSFVWSPIHCMFLQEEALFNADRVPVLMQDIEHVFAGPRRSE